MHKLALLLCCGFALGAVGCHDTHSDPMANSLNEMPVLDPAARNACLDQGGVVELNPITPQEVCIITLEDGGKPCQSSQDCTGYCLADSKTCSTESPLFGCIDELVAPGQAATLCID